jgi:hypothetical protein
MNFIVSHEGLGVVTGHIGAEGVALHSHNLTNMEPVDWVRMSEAIFELSYVGGGEITLCGWLAQEDLS